jgi:hypothetical protein
VLARLPQLREGGVTPAEIDTIEALAAAATPGPWEALPCAGNGAVVYLSDGDSFFLDSAQTCAFIAAARVNVPKLCAALRVTQSALDAAALDAGVRSQGVQSDLRTAMRRAIDLLRYWRELPVGDGGITEARSAFDILRAALEVTPRG